ncbi:hypothetical protein [Tateyamaria pelophila]|uniref:hypothetical protein n=1 Tax=Tateyamaria pelophila TaxID=328415 RepID=UPI001CBEC443|nr:hypothetical protein [Tateyamaria pelophila]
MRIRAPPALDRVAMGFVAESLARIDAKRQRIWSIRPVPQRLPSYSTVRMP